MTPLLNMTGDALLRDFRLLKGTLWKRFSVGDPQQHLWYYKSLLEVYRARFSNSWLVDELSEVIETLRRELLSGGAS
jgi:hypothetical protein